MTTGRPIPSAGRISLLAGRPAGAVLRLLAARAPAIRQPWTTCGSLASDARGSIYAIAVADTSSNASPPRGPHLATQTAPTPAGGSVLSVSERDHLVRLLALVPPPHRWAFEHRHMPVLCALGILDPPDEGYARAARRRFADPSETRERALALVIELERETRASPNAYRRLAGPRLWRSRVRVDPRGTVETPWVGRQP